MKKKILSIALCATMVASMTACGLKSPDTTTAAATQAATEKAAEAATEKAGETETKAEAEAGSEAAGDLASAANDPKVVLVYAEVNPLDTIVGQVATKFKDRVEELSGGSIEIDIQASGVLGAEGDVLDNIVGGVGTIDMARLSVSTMTAYGVQKSTLLALPYEFVSRDHFWNFAESDIAQEFLDEPRELGLGMQGLFLGEEGFRHIFTRSEIKGLEDLKGMKIRVSTDPTMVAMIEAFGASATVVSYNELYSSLQTGVVDGAENPINNYKSNAFNEVAPYLILDGHQLGVCEVVITTASWDKLTDAQKACMKQAAAECAEFNKQISEQGEQDALAELGDSITVIPVEDKTPWIEACADLIADATKDYQDLHKAIQELQ